MFKIHEYSSASGALSSVCLRTEGDFVRIVSDDGSWPLPEGALHAVFSRFGAPFDEAARSHTVATLPVPDGATLRHVRHLAGYDVIARDYLVYEPRDSAALCAMAATVAAALLHLGRANQEAK